MGFLSSVNQVLVLFLIIVAGFISRRIAILDAPVTRGLSSLVVNLTMPALIVVSMQLEFSPERFAESLSILTLSAACYAFYIAAAYAVSALLRAESADRGVYRFSTVFANVGFMGFPVLEALWGRSILFHAALFNVGFHVLLFSVGTRLIAPPAAVTETMVRTATLRPARASLINPGTVATAAGFLFFLTSFRLPFVLHRPLELLAGMTTPLSLFVIGSFLAGSDLRSMWTNLRIYAFTVVRLAVMPLLVYSALTLAGLREELLNVPVMLAAMPVAANAAIMADCYGGDSGKASQIVFVSTLFSVVTIPAVWLLLG